MKVVLTLPSEKRTVIHCREIVLSPDEDMPEDVRSALSSITNETGNGYTLTIKEVIIDGTS